MLQKINLEDIVKCPYLWGGGWVNRLTILTYSEYTNEKNRA